MERDRTDGLVKPSFGSNDPAVIKGGSDMTDIITASGCCFDCNICLDFVTEPVVTLCGHLYCWPCLYKWLSPGLAGEAEDGGASHPQQGQCPVCKAAISANDVVPLYGRGHNAKKPDHTLGIPCRPSVHRQAVEYQSPQSSNADVHEVENHLQIRPVRRHQGRRNPDNLGELELMYPTSPLGTGLAHSTAGELLVGMVVAVLPWAMRGHMRPPGMEMYYENLHHMMRSNSNPRLRWQQIKAESLLHHLCFFLFVFVVLCLLLF